MKILRLTNSSDAHGGVPEELRAPAVAARFVEEATGEKVETIQRGLSPTEAFPAVIDRWMDQYEPDVILFRLSSFWVAYESVPLRKRPNQRIARRTICTIQPRPTPPSGRPKAR